MTSKQAKRKKIQGQSSGCGGRTSRVAVTEPRPCDKTVAPNNRPLQAPPTANQGSLPKGDTATRVETNIAQGVNDLTQYAEFDLSELNDLADFDMSGLKELADFDLKALPDFPEFLDKPRSR